MSLFSKKKEFFTAEENQLIVQAIRNCESRTSGEIRVYMEAKNPYVDPLERAAEIFAGLKMHLTDHRNGVLLYIAVKHKELALFGDTGIYEKLGKEFWNEEVRKMISNFSKDNLTEGIVQCVYEVGEALHQAFPYIATEDKNELPDEIVFGKI
ncbi:MAG: hypothetical protein JWQ27_1130 [Ferruginibacter sp.]|nr:hypothetical protein [Ferruginibacter sp.]